MDLTPDYLREQIAALTAERDRRLAALNAAIGGLEVLEHLLAQVEAPDVPQPAPEPEHAP